MSIWNRLTRRKKGSKDAPKKKKNPQDRSRAVTLRVMQALFEGGTTKGLAEVAGVSERTVFRVIDAAKLAGFKVTRNKSGVFRAVRRRKTGGQHRDASRDM